MTFPVIPTVAAGRVLSVLSTDTSGGTVTSPNLSSLTKNSGDLLIAICITYDGNSTNAEFSSWGGGFTEFVDQATTTTMGIGCAYKWSTGSETGTFTVAIAGGAVGNDAAFFLLSIPGAHLTTPPEGGTIANGTTAAADPASFNPAGWGTEDTLWIAVGASGEINITGSYTGIASAPTNYTGYADSGMSADIAGAVEGAVAFRQLNAASEDVGGFSVDLSNARNSALILAVRPRPDDPKCSGCSAGLNERPSKKPPGWIEDLSSLLLTTLAVAPFPVGDTHAAACIEQPKLPKPHQVEHVQSDVIRMTAPLPPRARAPFNVAAGYRPGLRGEGYISAPSPLLFGEVAAPFRPPLEPQALVRPRPADTLQGSLTAEALLPPFVQYDWINGRYVPRYEVYQQQNLLISTLAVAEVPFIPTDWPEARVKKAPSLEQQPSLQATTLATDALSLLRYQPDWNGTRFRQRNDEAPQQNLLATTLAPAEAAPFTAADFSGKVRLVQGDSSQQVNLLGNTLAPAAATPFVPASPLDAPKRKLSADEVVQNTLVRIPPETMPLRSGSWPQERQVKPRFEEYTPVNIVVGTAPTYRARVPDILRYPPPRSQFLNDPVVLNYNPIRAVLIGKPPIPVVWPEPTKVKPRVAEQPPNLLTSTLFITSLTPDLYLEPTRKQRRYEEQLTNRTPLTTPSFKPFVNFDWNNSRKQRYQYDTLVGNRLPIIHGDIFKPISTQLTEPGKQQRKEDIQQFGSAVSLLFQLESLPFIYYDWTGRPAKAQISIDPYSTNIALLVPPQAEPQFGAEFPVGKPKDPIRYVEHTPSPTALLREALVTPFVQASWPEGLIKARLSIPDYPNLAIFRGVAYSYEVAIETDIALNPTQVVAAGGERYRYMWTKFIA